MILDIARLLLFPALMAFAAASDLFTMTISNRVSLALAGGFVVLALLSGMGLHDVLSHIGRRRRFAVALPVCDGLTAAAMPGGGSRSTLVSWPSAGLLCLAVRRRPDLLLLSSGSGRCPTRSPARIGCSSCTPRTAEFPTASRWRWRPDDLSGPNGSGVDLARFAIHDRPE
jgi:hypothetical protein